MAVFAPLFDQLLSSVFKQISADYNLDYKEMMDRYTGKSSFAIYSDHDQETIDLEKPAPVKESKKVAIKSKKMEEVKPMALSKMKKADLVSELEDQGIDTDGLNVAKLKELVKEAREKSGSKPSKGGKKAKEPEPEPEPSPKKKTKKSKKADSPKKKSKKAKEPEPEPEPELEEEEFEIEPVVDPVEFEEDEEDLEAANQEDLEARLRAIIAEANGDEEESDEEVDPTEMTQVLEEEEDSPGAVRARMLRK